MLIQTRPRNLDGKHDFHDFANPSNGSVKISQATPPPELGHVFHNKNNEDMSHYLYTDLEKEYDLVIFIKKTTSLKYLK